MMNNMTKDRRPWQRVADFLFIALTAALLLWAGAVQITVLLVH